MVVEISNKRLYIWNSGLFLLGGHKDVISIDHFVKNLYYVDYLDKRCVCEEQKKVIQ
jgi:hypothetical protein